MYLMTCKECGKVFETRIKTQVYHNQACYGKHKRENHIQVFCYDCKFWERYEPSQERSAENKIRFRNFCELDPNRKHLYCRNLDCSLYEENPVKLRESLSERIKHKGHNLVNMLGSNKKLRQNIKRLKREVKKMHAQEVFESIDWGLKLAHIWGGKVNMNDKLLELGHETLRDMPEVTQAAVEKRHIAASAYMEEVNILRKQKRR